MTDAERQRRATARRKAAGMVQVRVWVPVEAEAAVRAAIDKALQDAAQVVALPDAPTLYPTDHKGEISALWSKLTK